MPGIGPAADRIRYAIVHKEKITIYGDYDVDGITAVAILWQLFTLLGADVDYYIPHRVDEGYGLNTQAIRTLAQNGTKLLITVDCGITALASADLAGQLGIELIITDHHLPGPKLPQAYAIVHPALDAAYPNPDSSGAMVAFKLAWSIAEQFKSGRSLEPQIREHMLNATALAAMGTVADVVDLRGENRILTSYGLKSLPQCRLPGVQALIESANLTGRGLDTYHIGFRLAPMLNAAGRMGHARLAVELLTTDSHIRAAKIAEYLKDQNTLRQKCEKKIFEQACDMIVRKGLSHPDRKSIVLADESWHTGIIGIVASKLVDRFYRPTVMIGVPARNNHAPNGPAGANPADTIAQGSARSIPGFSLLDAITACSGHLIDFGGHKMAAGFTIKLNKIENFTDDFEQYARQNLREDDIIAKLSIDAVAPLTTFSAEIVKELGLLEPFGQGNHRPIFATNGVRLAAPPRKVGAKSDHLQLTVTDNRTTIRCVGFNFGRLEKKLLEKEFFNIAFEPRLNQYNGATNVECILADIQFD
jgi:single-stranded-DNA-specific exonuclease